MHTVTPAMRQYLEAKRQHPTALVFFRMGDFYEMFYEDAIVGARALDLTLTSRAKDAGGQGVPMCGVPFHAADGYITKLVSKGFRVAICEQVEDPKKAKGLVRREVVRVVSPGTLTDGTYLDAREPLFLMAIVAAGEPGPGPAAVDGVGVALIDLSTGEFRAAEYAGTSGTQALADELSVLRPREILVPRGTPLAEMLPEITALGCTITEADEGAFDARAAERTSWSSSGSRVWTVSGCATAWPPREPPEACCGICATRTKRTSATFSPWRSDRRPTPCASTP